MSKCIRCGANVSNRALNCPICGQVLQADSIENESQTRGEKSMFTSTNIAPVQEKEPKPKKSKLMIIPLALGVLGFIFAIVNMSYASSYYAFNPAMCVLGTMCAIGTFVTSLVFAKRTNKKSLFGMILVGVIIFFLYIIPGIIVVS